LKKFILAYLGVMICGLIYLRMQSGVNLENLFPTCLQAIIIALIIRVVLLSKGTAYNDKISNAIVIVGMIITIIGFGALLLFEQFPILADLIWLMLIGVIMIIAASYIRYFRMFTRK
jgi:hypothetical protein